MTHPLGACRSRGTCTGGSVGGASGDPLWPMEEINIPFLLPLT